MLDEDLEVLIADLLVHLAFVADKIALMVRQNICGMLYLLSELVVLVTLPTVQIVYLVLRVLHAVTNGFQIFLQVYFSDVYGLLDTLLARDLFKCS